MWGAVGAGIWIQPGGMAGGAEVAPRLPPRRFGSLYEQDPPISNQGLISQLAAPSSIIPTQTN